MGAALVPSIIWPPAINVLPVASFIVVGTLRVPCRESRESCYRRNPNHRPPVRVAIHYRAETSQLQVERTTVATWDRQDCGTFAKPKFVRYGAGCLRPLAYR